jgi:hypothetical protein
LPPSRCAPAFSASRWRFDTALNRKVG